MTTGDTLIALWTQELDALETLAKEFQQKKFWGSATGDFSPEAASNSVQETAHLLAANMLLLDGAIAPEEEAFVRAAFGFGQDNFDYYRDELEKVRSESLRFLEEVPPIL